MSMSYITTKLQPLKSYPTYQFYARVDSKSLDLQCTFKICILETFKWLRARLKKFSDLPEGMLTPEPENYADFSDESIISFSYSNGLSVDVVYIEKKGVWSFRMTESDIGANIGKENERKPVQGRTFSTEIAFLKQGDYIEAGVRTICSEPSDTTADCEVFRPTVVKALADNANVRLMQSGFILNKKPLEINSKSDLERFFGIYEDNSLNFPIVLVADSETEIKEIDIEKISTLNKTFSAVNCFSAVNVTLENSNPNLKNISEFIPDKRKKSKDKPKETIRTEKVKLPVFDYVELARGLVGFAVVVFADDRYFKQISNKTHINLSYGDIVVISRKNIIERYSYKDYYNNMSGFLKSLRYEINAMPKRKQYDFGNVLFHSDAKLKEYHTKRHETTSLEEECRIYRLENAELKSQIKDISQYHTDMQQTVESLRTALKKIDSLQKELETCETLYKEALSNNEQKESAYQKSAELISFYKNQIEIAALFPTDKDKICDWIENSFAENIVLTQRAKAEMRKFSGNLDISSFCDGIVYMNSYAKYRKHEISEVELQLYAERNNWEVQNCGKETIKMRKSDYTVTYENEQYILDLHIKHGVKAEELLRIYFCWDEKRQKIFIGSMPGHLATTRQGT